MLQAQVLRAFALLTSLDGQDVDLRNSPHLGGTVRVPVAAS